MTDVDWQAARPITNAAPRWWERLLSWLFPVEVLPFEHWQQGMRPKQVGYRFTYSVCPVKDWTGRIRLIGSEDAAFIGADNTVHETAHHDTTSIDNATTNR